MSAEGLAETEKSPALGFLETQRTSSATAAREWRNLSDCSADTFSFRDIATTGVRTRGQNKIELIGWRSLGTIVPRIVLGVKHFQIDFLTTCFTMSRPSLNVLFHVMGWLSVD